MKNEFGIDFSLNINPYAFKSSFTKHLNDNSEIKARKIFLALMEGLKRSNEYSEKNIATAKYLLFKKPQSTEFFAKDYFREDPTAKFIHIIRHPYHTYASIKSRKLKKWHQQYNQIKL